MCSSDLITLGDGTVLRFKATLGPNNGCGALEPLFDVDRLAETALRVLADPPEFRPLGQAGRRLVEGQYSLNADFRKA